MDHISPSLDPERELRQTSTSSFTLSPIICSALSPQWLVKIASNRQRISYLSRKLLAEESANSLEKESLAESTPASNILERLKIKQHHLIHIISNLISVNDSSPSSSKEPNGKPELIEWLKGRGYVSLANKLINHKGYPWNEIANIGSPILMEQLVDIYLLCQHKKGKFDKDDLSTPKIMDFALHLASLVTTSSANQQYLHSYELINDAKQILGQLLYLINQDVQMAFKAIDTPLYQDALENIKDEFSLKIQEICKRLQSCYIDHYETRLQDPQMALHTIIPLEIAKALLTDIGTINVGIIDSLSDIFLPHDKAPINYEANLSYALTILQRSPKLRAEFEKIQAPRSTTIHSNDVIKISLGLSPQHSIDYLDARLATLTALLSHLRQGEDRSCFAVSLAIEILSAHLGFCIKDLRQLLEEGKLTRSIKGIRKDIPFAKRMSDENLHKQVSFNSSGDLIIQGKKKASLWKAPGLQAACQAIGIHNPREIILATIKDLPPLKKGKFHTLEIKELIQKICEHVHKQHSNPSSSSFDQLYTQACFAFSSKTAQPILKIWENALANMAEAEEGSMIKTAILESTLDALQFKLGQLKIPPSLLLQRFFLHIQKSLYENIRLQYDPFILSNANESNTKEGGFVLYRQTKRIDDQKAFRTFILDTLLEVNKKMRHSEMSDIETQELNQVLDILTPYMDSDEFMGYLLARYHPSNKFAVSQLTHGEPLPYQHLQFTPWITQTGNNSKALLKIYFETNKPIQTERFISSGAEEALTNIIEMCKRMSGEEKRLYLNNPNKLKPLCIVGKHRLPFMAGNPLLSTAWQEDCPTKEWIERVVLKPGREIAEALLDKETQQNFNENLKKNVLSKVLSTEKMNSCIDLIQHIPNGLTIKEYRNRVLQICQNITLLPLHTSEKIVRQLDTMLCQSLEPSLKKKLEESAVHFADTNWCNGIQDIHFCFAVNPGTGELELWEAYANGSHLMALDQHYWLFNQKWEFLTIQDDLISDDSSNLV